MNRKIINGLLLFCILITFSCTKDDPFGEINTEASDYVRSKGFFVLNEGNFTWGNGTVSFYDELRGKLIQDVFYSANKRPTGDIPTSMQIIGDFAFVVVNNSGKIEVVHLDDFHSVTTIKDLGNPRFILPINSQKAYVSDLRSPWISILNPQERKVVGKFYAGKSTDKMALFGNKAFILNWSEHYIQKPNNTLLIADVIQDKIIDSLILTKEPNSLVIDKYHKLWVLCSGGFNYEEIPALYKIDPQLCVIEQKFEFPSQYLSPTSLVLNNAGDTLYYINQGIYKMAVNAMNLPSQSFIPKANHLFYALAVNPSNGQLLASDALDYNQNGWVFRYEPNGWLKDSIRAGIIPGSFCFMNN